MKTMKKLLFSFILAVLAYIGASAQLHVPQGASMHIKSGTALSIDSLTLVPAADLTLTDVTIDVDYTPIPGVPTGASIARVYTISNPLNFTGIAGLFYDLNELNGNTATSLQLAYRTNTGWTTTTGSTVNTTTQHVSNTLINPTALLKVTAVNNATTLPLMIIDFTAKAEKNRSRIEWTTANERDVIRFEIERSIDGANYSKFAATNATNEPEGEYLVYDEHPVEGLNYYRLSEIDANGQRTYHGVRTVRFETINESMHLSIFPNPANDVVYVQLSGTTLVNAILRLTDVNGKIIATKAFNENNTSFDLTNLATGLYFVHYSDNQNSYTFKVVKQ